MPCRGEPDALPGVAIHVQCNAEPSSVSTPPDPDLSSKAQLPPENVVAVLCFAGLCCAVLCCAVPCHAIGGGTFRALCQDW